MSVSAKAARAASNVHIALYRRIGSPRVRRLAGLPVLLLTVRGRRSGKQITTPVCYIEVDDGFAVTGSAGGSDTDPQWFLNLRAAEEARIEVGTRTMRVRVRVSPPGERDAVWSRFLSEGKGFDGYERKTDRVIPVAVLTPV